MGTMLRTPTELRHCGGRPGDNRIICGHPKLTKIGLPLPPPKKKTRGLCGGHPRKWGQAADTRRKEAMRWTPPPLPPPPPPAPHQWGYAADTRKNGSRRRTPEEKRPCGGPPPLPQGSLRRTPGKIGLGGGHPKRRGNAVDPPSPPPPLADTRKMGLGGGDRKQQKHNWLCGGHTRPPCRGEGGWATVGSEREQTKTTPHTNSKQTSKRKNNKQKNKTTTTSTYSNVEQNQNTK